MSRRNRSSRSRSREKSPSHSRRRDEKRDRSSESARSNEEGSQQESKQPRWKVEETKTLRIENCVDKQAAERVLIDGSIKVGTSVPDEVDCRDNSIFAKYPSVEASTALLIHLAESITINGKAYKINFYPFNRIDLNMAYDWYCDKCDYKNFARRNRCYRCESDKTESCKLNYNTQTKQYKNQQDNINTCSLMVRGSVIVDIEEEMLLDIFEEFASIKDIRMIKNKMTGQFKDFAFIEFYNAEDAAITYKKATESDFRIKGEKVSIMYSRNKAEDDYAKPLPYERRERGRDRFGRRQKRQEVPVENYYNRQRQLEIEQEKLRPLITIEQLKEKHQQQMKKNASAPRQLTEEQNKRRQAQLMAKQWERQDRMQGSVMYICVVCRRKFKGEAEMRVHERESELHKFNMEKQALLI